MDAEIATKLRAPFPPEAVGKRPQPTCKACSDAPSRVCDRHQKAKCSTCGQFMTSAHTHLDYVGHADVTDRLLSVDPEWTWEPVADAPSLGLPVVDGGMWIRLTVAGSTKYGFGDGGGKRGPNAVKEMVGDAIRNAAMRFGVGLDMWMSGDRETARVEADEPAPPSTEAPKPPARQSTRPAAAQAGKPKTEADKVRDEIRKLATENGRDWDLAEVARGYAEEYPGRTLKGEPDPDPLRLFLANLLVEAAKEDEVKAKAKARGEAA